MFLLIIIIIIIIIITITIFRESVESKEHLMLNHIFVNWTWKKVHYYIERLKIRVFFGKVYFFAPYRRCHPTRMNHLLLQV